MLNLLKPVLLITLIIFVIFFAFTIIHSVVATVTWLLIRFVFIAIAGIAIYVAVKKLK